MIRLIAILVTLWAGALNATPDAAIHMQDQLLGANDSEYFVKRTTHYHPPTYYQGYVDEEIVSLSIWTGKVHGRCLLRRVSYTIDVHTGEKNAEFIDFPDCGSISKRMSVADVNPPRVTTSYLGPSALSLGPKGVMVEGFHQDQPVLLLKNTYVNKLAQDITTMRRGQLNPPKSFGFAEAFQIHQMSGDDKISGPCRVDPAPTEIVRSKWRFVHIICGGSDSDVNAANFFIPVSGTHWQKIVQQ